MRKSILQDRLRYVWDALRTPRKALLFRRRLAQAECWATPSNIVFFVTNACGLRCPHCFYWKELNQNGRELNLEEIARFVGSLERPAALVLTGGETFSRADLPGICAVFIRVNRTSCIQITTSGLFPDRSYEFCREILTRCALPTLEIQVSLDGLEETHDKIRGRKGAFQSAVRTIERLRGLQGRFSNLRLLLMTVIMKDNLHEIDGLIRYTQRFRIPHKVQVVRGAGSIFNLPPSAHSGLEPHQEREVDVALEDLEGIYDRVCHLNDSLEYKFLPSWGRRRFRLSLDILRAKERLFPCYAGRVDATVYPNGDTAFCEQTAPVANLRSFDCDFKRLWGCEEAQRMRAVTRQCACVQGDCLVTSLGSVPPLFLPWPR